MPARTGHKFHVGLRRRTEIDWLRHLPTRYRLRLTVYTILWIFSITGTRAVVGNEEKIDYVVAVVNGQAVTWTELRSALVVRAFVDPLVSLLPPLLDELKNPSDVAQRTILDILIDRTLMLQEAERWGIPLARWHDKVATDMERLKKSYPSELDFFETLKLSGLEYAELEEWMRAGLIIGDLIFRKFIKGIDGEKIEQESLRHFERHKSEYSEAARVRFKYVLVRFRLDTSFQDETQVKRSAEAIYSHLRNGMSIHEIQQSEHHSAQIKSGTGTERVDSKLGRKIAALKTNRWSSPIHTPTGYLIVNSLGVEKRRQQAYTEVKDEIKRMLIDKQVKDQMEKWLAEQKEIGNWRILDPSLAKTNKHSSRNHP
ncbi:MAG: peptidyl-prolyl cis-trans isomerase [Candidatus Poribacteria bacterium]|nr:peptidyl-prolyl cis-trans isomerase [Candidatus Poribacteria bacterium]